MTNTIIDLTHPIAEQMPMYPGTVAPTLHVSHNHNDHGFQETFINMYSHTGTHMDAPAHLFPDGLTLEKYPVEQFVGSALVIDCRQLKKGEKISMKLLEEKGNVIDKADFLLFLTGHSAYWGQPDYFFDFPVLTDEVIDWINDHKLKGIGIDASSFDPVTIGDVDNAIDGLHNHRAILKTNHTLLLENLCRLEEVGNEIFTLYALPLNTVNADGAPARIIATINKE